MPLLGIHTTSGMTITAPFEAWVVAILNSLPEVVRQDVYNRVSQMQGTSLLPDKFEVKEDELGGITIVERPVLDMKMLRGN